MKIHPILAVALAAVAAAFGPMAGAQPVPASPGVVVQQTEDAAHVSGAKGALMLCVRADTAASTAGSNGDYAGLICSAAGRVYVDGSGVTQPVSAASLPLPTGAAREDKQPALGTAGSPSSDVITVQGSSSGTALPVTVSSLPGTAPTAANQATANGHLSTLAGAVSSSKFQMDCITGCGGGTQFAEDAAHSSGALGTLALGVRKDTAASLAGTDGDYTAPLFDASGLLWSRIGAALPAGTNNIGDVDVVSSVLPTGAATSALQSATQVTCGGSTCTRFVQYDASGNPVDLNSAVPVGLNAGSNLVGKVKVTGADGTTDAAVKAASTAAAATDPALVVQLRPLANPTCTSKIAVNQTASTDLVTLTAKANICSIVLVSATAQSISLVEGTGTTCGTGTAAIIGGTTASLALAANSGFSSIAAMPWLKTATTGNHLCLLQSSSGNVSGVITYADAP